MQLLSASCEGGAFHEADWFIGNRDNNNKLANVCNAPCILLTCAPGI
jgi:hypothetical protein